MKPFSFLLLASFFLMSCSNQAAKEKAAARMAPSPVTITQVVGIGKVIPEKEIIQIAAASGGIVTKVLKSENDSIKKGETLLELDHVIEDAKCSQLNAAIITQQEQVKADEAAIQEYTAKYSNALTNLQRLQKLLSKGAETQQVVDDAQTTLQGNQSNLNRLLANKDVSKSKLTESRAALVVAQQEREQKIIHSPVNGKILEISVLTGGAVDTRQAFAQICPEGNIIADAEVDELYADHIKIGQKAFIRKLGSLDTLSTGTVYFTASFLKKKSLFTDQAGEKEDRRVREIKIRLNHPEQLLLNARVECVVDISETH